MSTLPSRRDRGRNKRKNWLLPVLLTLLLVGVVAGGWVLAAYFTPGSNQNILLMGVDQEGMRTDVLVLAHINPREKKVNLLSIPRDTLVEIDCGKREVCVTPDKMNHAHAYGGVDLTVDTVEHFLGVKVDGYVKVNFEGFQSLVDGLGGVDLLIDKDMNYEDPYAKPPLQIHFKAKAEPQHLDGKQALEYVRYRGNTGDIGRIEHTKRFFQAVASKAEKSGTAKLASLAPGMMKYVDTKLDLSTAVRLAKLATEVKMDQIRMETIPGQDFTMKDGRWVWQADPAKTTELRDELFELK
ncbi:MAG TPA: LCP family protein [Symbiobacteriaceae bacterium]|nr:LCP family protein [Symbiobacteriaceae bacterium]